MSALWYRNWWIKQLFKNVRSCFIEQWCCSLGNPQQAVVLASAPTLPLSPKVCALGRGEGCKQMLTLYHIEDFSGSAKPKQTVVHAPCHTIYAQNHRHATARGFFTMCVCFLSNCPRQALSGLQGPDSACLGFLWRIRPLMPKALQFSCLQKHAPGISMQVYHTLAPQLKTMGNICVVYETSAVPGHMLAQLILLQGWYMFISSET